MAKTEPPMCRLYKPGDLLAVTAPNCKEIFNGNDGTVNWADPRALSHGTHHPTNGNDNYDGEGEQDMQGGEKGTGNKKGTKDGEGKGMERGNGNGEAMEDGKEKAMEEGMAKGNSKGKGNVK
jgi:hypothetical protein